MNRHLFPALVVLSIGTSAAAIFLYQENILLRQQLAVAAPGVETGLPVEADEEESIGEERSANPSVVVAEQPGGDGEVGQSSARRDRREQRAENFSRMMTDPAMREVMLSRIKGRIDEEYNGLFVRLGLNEEQTEALRTFIGQRRMAYMQAGFLSRNADGDVQALAEIEAWRDAELAATEAGIGSVLGPEGMDVLTDYRAGRHDREFVETISRQSSYSGESIDQRSSEQLVSVLRSVRESTPVSVNPFDSPEGGGPSQSVSPQSVQRYLEDRRAQNKAVLSEAREFLTPAQLEALADRQIEQLEREAAQLDFQLRNPDMDRGRRWFGGGRGP